MNKLAYPTALFAVATLAYALSAAPNTAMVIIMGLVLVGSILLTGRQAR